METQRAGVYASAIPARIRRKRDTGKMRFGRKCAPEALTEEKEREKLPAVAAVSAITTAVATSATAAAAAIPAAATAASTTAIAATPTTATGALRLRTRFVDDKVPAPEVLTIQARHGAVGIFIVGDFDEGETPRLSREAIPNQ